MTMLIFVIASVLSNPLYAAYSEPTTPTYKPKYTISKHGRKSIDNALKRTYAVSTLGLSQLHEAYECPLPSDFLLDKRVGNRARYRKNLPRLIGIQYGNMMSCYIISANRKIISFVDSLYYFEKMQTIAAKKQAALHQAVQKIFSPACSSRLDKRLGDSESKKRL